MSVIHRCVAVLLVGSLLSLALKQVQEGRWVVVWPKESAAPGAKLIYPRPSK